MSTGHASNDSSHLDQSVIDHPASAEERADASADLKVILLVFTALVAIAVVTISGWSPQF